MNLAGMGSVTWWGWSQRVSMEEGEKIRKTSQRVRKNLSRILAMKGREGQFQNWMMVLDARIRVYFKDGLGL